MNKFYKYFICILFGIILYFLFHNNKEGLNIGDICSASDVECRVDIEGSENQCMIGDISICNCKTKRDDPTVHECVEGGHLLKYKNSSGLEIFSFIPVLFEGDENITQCIMFNNNLTHTNIQQYINVEVLSNFFRRLGYIPPIYLGMFNKSREKTTTEDASGMRKLGGLIGDALSTQVAKHFFIMDAKLYYADRLEENGKYRIKNYSGNRDRPPITLFNMSIPSKATIAYSSRPAASALGGDVYLQITSATRFMYKVGNIIQVYSQKRTEWYLAVVTDVNTDVDIIVRYRISEKDQPLWKRINPYDPTLARPVGDFILIKSKSRDIWYVAQVNNMIGFNRTFSNASEVEELLDLNKAIISVTFYTSGGEGEGLTANYHGFNPINPDIAKPFLYEYKINNTIQVFSYTEDKWLFAKVTNVHQDKSIDVQYTIASGDVRRKQNINPHDPALARPIGNKIQINVSGVSDDEFLIAQVISGQDKNGNIYVRYDDIDGTKKYTKINPVLDNARPLEPEQIHPPIAGGSDLPKLDIRPIRRTDSYLGIIPVQWDEGTEKLIRTQYILSIVIDALGDVMIPSACSINFAGRIVLQQRPSPLVTVADDESEPPVNFIEINQQLYTSMARTNELLKMCRRIGNIHKVDLYKFQLATEINEIDSSIFMEEYDDDTKESLRVASAKLPRSLVHIAGTSTVQVAMIKLKALVYDGQILLKYIKLLEDNSAAGVIFIASNVSYSQLMTGTDAYAIAFKLYLDPKDPEIELINRINKGVFGSCIKQKHIINAHILEYEGPVELGKGPPYKIAIMELMDDNLRNFLNAVNSNEELKSDYLKNNSPFKIAKIIIDALNCINDHNDEESEDYEYTDLKPENILIKCNRNRAFIMLSLGDLGAITLNGLNGHIDYTYMPIELRLRWKSQGTFLLGHYNATKDEREKKAINKIFDGEQRLNKVVVYMYGLLLLELFLVVKNWLGQNPNFLIVNGIQPSIFILNDNACEHGARRRYEIQKFCNGSGNVGLSNASAVGPIRENIVKYYDYIKKTTIPDIRRELARSMRLEEGNELIDKIMLLFQQIFVSEDLRITLTDVQTILDSIMT